ncbi:tyrosyl-DNA phosphodiesterase I [Amylocarpus encephaloides]|uniref:Tyrosyl-DNA phosphodiesterase I n=1 Tax=Amylocarpus encephaloides TaxID=45428 RepID=A0A9P8C3W9_9HELO|nr:tyrosyl-DNA phosphodiesterase I [Amylocarpus encephaloides]
MDERPQKRRRVSDSEGHDTQEASSHKTFTRAVSPPGGNVQTESTAAPRIVPSPFQLTWIRDLSEASNVDAVTLNDILGDPLIAECWDFNYLHDLDFLMDAFDPDVRTIVKVHVVHGFWKTEDQSRQVLKLQAAKYGNIELHTAFMPEMFGTHHSKMLILIRHDNTAQVVIHTANMIPFDWTNMTQAIWRSPLLPKDLASSLSGNASGVGSKFKKDLLNYLKAYNRKRTICKSLIDELSQYDFSEVRAALVASVPGRQKIETESATSWGWVGLRDALLSVPVQSDRPEIILQISSIATLGVNDKWLDKTLFKALSNSKDKMAVKPKYRIVFPTTSEVRRSLNGYQSGSAIHTKIQSAAQVKQLTYLKPLFTHWAGDNADNQSGSSSDVREAGRRRAAPHIKTYIRFTDHSQTSIDWMLMTSANLSKQAWGEAVNSGGEVRICSYEIGVMVWPELYGEGAKIVPAFKKDLPAEELVVDEKTVVGARMPYDLPLIPYGKDDLPWCATASYDETDWMGQTWKTA